MELVKNHVLVFVCSLIPKALASTFTSFIYTARFWRKGLEKVNMLLSITYLSIAHIKK